MYGIYANIWGILMVNVTIYSIHGYTWILWDCLRSRSERSRAGAFFLQFVCYRFVWRLGKDDLEITLKVVM